MSYDSTNTISCFNKLDSWLNKNGFAGYDPYDIKGKPIIIKLIQLGDKSKILALCREIVFEFLYMCPIFWRKIFGIKPSENAKAIGLFAVSYLNLYKHYKEDVYLKKANDCFHWLKENKSVTSTGVGWGYSFDWQSKCFIQAGTPNGVVTTVVGEAFWKHYQIFDDKESLEYCKNICLFLSTLPVDHISQDQICFSYTPLFINHVHNLNLFVAEFLIKTGIETENNAWIVLGNQAVNYTISNQLNNGAFEYNGPPDKLNGHIDNYHTGFVLRMLHSIWKLTKREDVFSAMQRCYSHYIENFFEDYMIPKLMPYKKYRIDIHSCAESINCLCELSITFPEGLKIANNILNWTIEHLQDNSGYFYYGILKSRFTGIPYISKIPYIRWGQAWMLKALSNYLITVDSKKV